MKVVFRLSIIICFLVLNVTSNIAQSPFESINVVPRPNKIEKLRGYFIVNANTKLIYKEYNGPIHKALSSLAGKINRVTGLSLSLSKESDSSNYIKFVLVTSPLIHSNEGYSIGVTKDSVIVKASAEAGLFYGLQTLLQLLPEEIESPIRLNNLELRIPNVRIEDEPRFQWRGLHLDVSRHFMSVQFIKKYLDNMAMHKLNTFHWHLTDDQGWRIEILKYPKLTEIGAWRKETLVNHQYVRPLQFDGVRHGGYYTQEEIKEIVKYAAERYITIIPEIDMPGHVTAAIASYPELGVLNDTLSVATRWGVFPNLYNVKDSTFLFLEEVLSEVMALFPSLYIHIGGDEARKEQWEKSEDIQKKIKELGLQDEKELQSYFIRRIEKFVNSKGRQIIGWDEILEGGIAPNAVVMTWRGEEGGIHAAKEGHKVIMTPGSHLYFDFYQGSSTIEPLAIGGYTPLSKVYEYNPVPYELRGTQGAEMIIGAQANVWTEYMKSGDEVEYMVFPRIAALSEAVWTYEENKDWKNFVVRVWDLLKRYEFKSINYSTSVFNVDIIPKNGDSNDRFLIHFKNELGLYEMRYTIDGSSVLKDSPIYEWPFPITKDYKIKAREYLNDGPVGRECLQEINYHLAFGKKVLYNQEYDTSAFVTNNYTLVDGIIGDEKNMYSNLWQRFKSDINIVIKLDGSKKIKGIQSSFIQISGYAYTLPTSFEVLISNDGKKFKKINYSIDSTASLTNTSIVNYKIQFKKLIKASYIQFIAKNPIYKLNEITGKKGTAVLMTDEILVY